MPDARSRAWTLARDGFRQRGVDVTRLEAFTDAAFAFAVTLLVISIGNVPTTYRELVQSLVGVPAFAISFTLLMLFWWGHWEWSRRFGLEDGPSIIMSALLVFTVLVYVYPLKFMLSALTWWLSRGRVANARIDDIDQLFSIFLIYGIGFTAMALTIAALNVYALRRARLLDLDGLEILLTRTEIARWLVIATAGIVSCVLAVTTPARPTALPGFTYMLIPVAMPVVIRRVSRGTKELQEERRRDYSQLAEPPG